MGLFSKDRSTIVNGAVDLVKNVRGMIDDSKLTDEERIKYHAANAKAASDFVKDTMAENTERSRARRSIAIFLVYFFCGLVIALLILWKFDREWFEAGKDMVIGFDLHWAFLAVITFFFGAHVLRGYQQKNIEKGDKK